MDLSCLTPANLSFRTERLSIRVMNQHDLPHFTAMQADPTLMTYIGDILTPEALEAKFLTRNQCFSDHSQWFTLLIFDRTSSAFCGSIGFLLENVDAMRVEIGYLLLSEQQGKGIITEAAKPMMDFIFTSLKAKKIVAKCAVENTSSWKVMERLSLKREGCLISDFYVGDTWFDSYYYGLINPNS